MTPIISTNVAAVGYDTATQTMRVQFHDGGIYDYHDVSASLHQGMLQPNPWRIVGREVRAHAFTRIA